MLRSAGQPAALHGDNGRLASAEGAGRLFLQVRASAVVSAVSGVFVTVLSFSLRRCAPAVLLAAFSVLPLAVTAQTPDAPRLGQAGKDVMWLPSPDAAVDRMLQMAEVGPQDLVVDLGAGDGKIAIAAARQHGARALGLEYNPALVTVAARRAQEAGVADRVAFRQADIFATDFSSATVVTMYLLPELNLRLRPTLFRMAPGTRVVSHSFDMGDWTPDESAVIGTAKVMAWKIPAHAAGEWEIQGAAAEGPNRLRLRQTRQRVDGDVSFGRVDASLIAPRLSGDRLRFTARTAGGALLHVDARIEGDRMTGTAAQDTGARAPFTAVRRTPAPPIGGIEASDAEIQRAHRVLDAAG